MALILQLSDLHLTGPKNPVPIADRKAKVVKLTDSGTRSKLLASSLSGLGEELRASGEELDAVVISGDIANAGVSEGYAELPSILDSLGDSLPSRDRILIVPGNHDVDRNATGDARFAGIRTLRDEGYLVGWLSRDEVTTEPAPVLYGTDGSYVLVGINSSFYAGSTLDEEPKLVPHLPDLEKQASTNEAVNALLAAWRSRGNADLARVSDDELSRLHTLLGTASADGSGPLRIVALHHQLLPVNTNEEIKPFESMTNLGHFRRWLASNSIDLVLHGHKHSNVIMRDRIDNGSSGSSHELTIMSAPSIVDARAADAAIAQLIRIPTTSPRNGAYEAIIVPAVEAGTTRPLAMMDRRRRPLYEQALNGVLSGPNVDAVYAKIQAVSNRVNELPTPLVCRIEDGNSALTLPREMVDVPAPEDGREDWLKTVVKWWQRETPGKAAAFNHGQFLRVAGRHDKTAVERIVHELGQSHGSSRALAVLVTQDTMHEKKEFPSFISLQFVIRANRLEAIAYFRKQELLHWWPINLVEIAQIQREVAGKMSGNHKWECGSITTVTAIPVAVSEMPTVAVPKLDLLVDEPGGLLKLVLPLFNPASDADETLLLWEQHFEDWVPEGSSLSASHTLPKLGLEELAATIAAASESYAPNEEVENLVWEIRSLDKTNKSYDEDDHERWAEEARGHSARVLKVVRKIFASRPTRD